MFQVFLTLLRPAVGGNRVARILAELAREREQAKAARRLRRIANAAHKPQTYDCVDLIYLDAETIGG